MLPSTWQSHALLLLHPQGQLTCTLNSRASCTVLPSQGEGPSLPSGESCAGLSQLSCSHTLRAGSSVVPSSLALRTRFPGLLQVARDKYGGGEYYPTGTHSPFRALHPVHLLHIYSFASGTSDLLHRFKWLLLAFPGLRWVFSKK